MMNKYFVTARGQRI